MVLQYKLKTEKRWKRYSGKDEMKDSVSKCDFILLNEKKTKVLLEGDYTKVLRRMRQVEFFKHKS